MLSRLLLSRLSLTRRLSLFFTLVATSVVLGLGGLFMTAADRHFIELDRSVLQDKRHLIDDILASANSAEDLRWRLSEALNHHHGLFARVTTPTGQTLFQTEGFPEPDRWLLPEHETLLHALTREQHGQRQYRTQQFRAQAQYAPEAPLVITLAMDTIHHRHFLDDLLRTFAVYALAAILVSGLLGWAAVYYGLAPLRAIKAHAAAVTAQRLQACMPVQAVPAEMADLAQTLNQMLERLQDDFRRLSEFASDLAHELRTPISNMLTQTQVTLATPRANAAYRDILASNAEELQRLARMVADMLFLAKTERGVDLPHKERFMAADEAQALLDAQKSGNHQRDLMPQYGFHNNEHDRTTNHPAMPNYGQWGFLSLHAAWTVLRRERNFSWWVKKASDARLPIPYYLINCQPRPTMPIDYNDSNARYHLIKISGRLDNPGPGEIKTKFAALASSE